MSWAQLGWRYNETPISFYVVFTNDTDYDVSVTSIVISAGTVLGDVGDSDGSSTNIGPSIHGDGLPILLNVNGITQSISNTVNVVQTENGNDINSDDLQDYRFALNLSVPPHDSTSISVVASGGSCLAISKLTGDSTSDEPEIEQCRIIYDANGGVFTSGDSQYVQYYEKNSEFSMLETDVIEGAIHTIKFDPNGGISSGAIVSINQNLLEWNTQPDGSGESFKLGQSYLIESDMMCYAIWSDPKLTNDMIPPTYRDGYLLHSWNTASDGSGTELLIGSEIDSDIEVYAIWESSPIMIMTEVGWRPLTSHQLSNVSNVRNMSRKSNREVEWLREKPIYTWNGTTWIQMHRGSMHELK